MKKILLALLLSLVINPTFAATTRIQSFTDLLSYLQSQHILVNCDVMSDIFSKHVKLDASSLENTLQQSSEAFGVSYKRNGKFITIIERQVVDQGDKIESNVLVGPVSLKNSNLVGAVTKSSGGRASALNFSKWNVASVSVSLEVASETPFRDVVAALGQAIGPLCTWLIVSTPGANPGTYSTKVNFQVLPNSS